MTFNNTHIQDKITRLFFEKLHVEVPSADTDLFETGMIDSLAFVELLVQLEQEFGAVIPIENLEIEHFRSIAKISELVHCQVVSQARHEAPLPSNGREASHDAH